MENEIQKQEITKVAFYKRKAVAVPMIALFALALISATIAYYHTTEYNFTVSEGRSSTDTIVAQALFTGETFTTGANIHNAANATLCTMLSWREMSNSNNTIYTTNLPIKVTNAPLSDSTTYILITVNEVSPSGLVIGNLDYTPVACSS